MIRVLHCVVGMNYGGYETFIMNVYRNIDRSHVQFDFLTSLEGVYDNEIRSLGGRIFRIPFITKVGPFSYNSNLVLFLQAHPEYEIVHSHMDKFSGMIMRAAARNNVPIRISHSHSTDNEGGFVYKLVKNYYGKLINKYCTHRFACSLHAGSWLFNNKNFVVLKNGIDVQLYIPSLKVRSKIRSSLNIENKLVIGHVGRFNSPKNHLFLVDIFNEIKKKKADTVLLLVGEGELKGDIIKKISALGLSDDIIFYGTTDKVYDVLQAMDCFVFPSTHEGLGIALVEAQSAGLKCIASDKVPKDADFTSTVKFLSLSQTPQIWADDVLNYSPTPTNILQSSAKTGYDINHTAKKLEDYYKSRMEGYEKDTFRC